MNQAHGHAVSYARADMSYLNVEDLNITYGETTGSETVAVDDLNLRMGTGDFLSIIGPSGCGKSTLLHTIGGLIKPTYGNVKVDGTVVNNPQPDKLAFVFQDYSLFPWKPVWENVSVGLKFSGVSKRERKVRAMHYLAVMGLGSDADSYPGELSGGMQQRVAVARALAMEPDALLMDEPFGALDEITRRDLGVEISTVLSNEAKSVMIVTHSLDEAIFWGDRVAVMTSRPGRILETIEITKERPRTVDFISESDFEDHRVALLNALTKARGGTAADEQLAPNAPE